MSMSSQEPRGQGLSSSLVSDFRAILNTLEHERASRPVAPPAGGAGGATDADRALPDDSGAAPQTTAQHVVAPTMAETAPGFSASPPPRLGAAGEGAPRRRVAAGERPVAMDYAELRSRIAALGDVQDMFPARRAAPDVTPLAPEPEAAAPRPLQPAPRPVPVAAPAPAVARISEEPRAPEARPAPVRSASPAAPSVADVVPESRRRGFGASRFAENDVPVRRRRATSSEAITWRRVAVLVACMGVVGGGAVALQSVVGREEAKVAPEAIGNAAIASVAPSSGASLITAAVAAAQDAASPDTAAAETAAAEPRPTVVASTQEPEFEPDGDSQSVEDVMAGVPKPVLRNAKPVFDASELPPLPASVTAFAPGVGRIMDTSPADAGTDSAGDAKDAAALKHAPLPPPAPSKHASAAKPVADAAADEPEAEPAAATAASPFGGEPVGVVELRSSVTMRAAPKRGAAILSNLQSGQKVDLVACTSWCEVIVDGKRGYVYKSFVDQKSLRQADAAGE